MNIIEENIENLTSLWRTECANSYQSVNGFEYCYVNDSQWPNRLWFRHDISESSLLAAKNHLRSISGRLMIPYWDIYQSRSYELLEKHGFTKLSEQIGMSLRLSQAFEETGAVQLIKVSNAVCASMWEDLFKQAFNYKISPMLLLSSLDQVSYFIAFHHNRPFGTAALHYSGEAVVGIHSMGVIPEMRRRGLAEQMMITLLSQSIERGYKYATLQASELGKILYLKLGFKEQFILNNYALP